MRTILLSLLSAFAPPEPEPRAEVVHLASKHQVVVTAGPFTVQAMPPGMKHEEMDMMEDHNTPVYKFTWPADGWARGFGVEILDRDGNPIDRRLIHHMIVVNFSRRQLLYSSFERLFGIGQETQDASVPKTVGVPLTPDTRLGFYLAWANETGKDLDGVQVRMTISYSPPNLHPRPVTALPIYMDANLTVGVGNDFDLPPGRFEKSWEFTAPLAGRLLGVGGHLHDFGVEVRLEDVATGKVLARVKGQRTPEGRLIRVERKLFAVRGAGLPLREGRTYRVVGVYDNPTGAVIKKGGMAHIVGLFVPEEYARWPRLDLGDPTLQDDLAFLTEMGNGKGHKHH